jgi:hypothetical protein
MREHFCVLATWLGEEIAEVVDTLRTDKFPPDRDKAL